MNIVNCALLGALVLSMPERLTDFYEYPGGSGYEGRFTRCGICTLMQELGSYDLTLALCHPDYTMSETGGATSFVRTYTLASGGPYCDCGYKKKMCEKVPLGFLGVLAAQDLNAGGAEQHTGGKHGKSLHGRSLLYILQQLDVLTVACKIAQHRKKVILFRNKITKNTAECSVLCRENGKGAPHSRKAHRPSEASMTPPTA